MDHENCPDRPADRIRAPEAVRRHGARRVLHHRGARRPRPRRDAVRERRFDDAGEARTRVAARAAARFVDPRPGRAAHAADGDGRAPREGFRRAPFPHGLLLVLGLQPAGNALRDDAARPARPARAATGVRHVQYGAGDLDFQCAAPAVAAGKMADDRLSRAARYAVHAAARRAALSRVPRPHLAGKTRRYRDPHRPPVRAADPDRREDRRGRPGILRPRDQAAFRVAARRIHRRDRRSREGRIPVGRACAAVSDRLAGAVRPRDDRGDVVRHAGDRVQPRRGARSGGRGRVGVHRRGRNQCGGRREPAAPAAAGARAAALRGALHVAPDGAAVRRRVPVGDPRAEALALQGDRFDDLIVPMLKGGG
ncbi:hypothetical protein BCEN4_210003 [Burkholderia cenocepacia]|nr:hypothetical protein BCEN4_210003 [Burkholderia cenocepacia]